MKFALFQGIVQILMNRYQLGRLYNLVAIGKATRMDVTTDIFDKRFPISIKVLLPFLIIGNCFQGYISYHMLEYYWTNYPNTEWQVGVIGVIFITFAVGNFWTALGSSISKAYAKTTK